MYIWILEEWVKLLDLKYDYKNLGRLFWEVKSLCNMLFINMNEEQGFSPTLPGNVIGNQILK